MISVAIVTYNEANQLARCLRSVHSWADEVVVIDLGSTDASVHIAKAYGCRVVTHTHVTHVELVRDFAIAQCQGGWILVLDPDEWLPHSLKRILSAYAATHTEGSLNIPRLNIFFNQWIQHTNFWPDYQIRFFSAGSVTWQKLLHSYPNSTVPVVALPRHHRYAIRHQTYPSLHSLFAKQARYAVVRAIERQANKEQASVWNWLYALARELASRYLWHAGFLDGKEGIYLLVGLFYYHSAVEWKLYQLGRAALQAKAVSSSFS